MPETLSLNLTPPAGAGAERYWIRLAQIKEPELATHEEAGEVVDELFALDPCIPEEEKDDPPPEKQKSKAELYEEAIERYKKLVANRLYGSMCDDAEDGFLAEVKLTRSHQALQYTLLPQNCAVMNRRVGSERISRTVPVDNGSQLNVDIPADLPITVKWSGAVYSAAGRLDAPPEIKVEKGNVYWQGNVSGAVRLTYDQPFHILEIETDGEDAALTAIFKFSADEITIEPQPQDDEIVEEVCDKIEEDINIPPETGSCIHEKTNLYHCHCSNKRVETRVIHLNAPCPDGVDPGSVVKRSSEKFYIDCGEVDDVHDPDFYTEVCCDPAPSLLPICRKRRRAWNGKGIGPDLLEQLKKTYGPDTRIVVVGPDPEPCGTLTYEQDVNQRNCCDGVSPIYHDEERSADSAPANGTCDVFVAGGEDDRPFFWEVRGVGFYTDPARTQRDKVSGRGLRIYTEDACGLAAIFVTDGCSSASFYLPAPGTWHLVFDNSTGYYPEGSDPVAIAGGKLFPGTPESPESSNQSWFEIYTGNLYIRQQFVSIPWDNYNDVLFPCDSFDTWEAHYGSRESVGSADVAEAYGSHLYMIDAQPAATDTNLSHQNGARDGEAGWTCLPRGGGTTIVNTRVMVPALEWAAHPEGHIQIYRWGC